RILFLQEQKGTTKKHIFEENENVTDKPIVPLAKKRNTGFSSKLESSFFDSIVQKTKEINSELKSLLMSKDLVNIKDSFIVKLKKLELINLPVLSENKIQDPLKINEDGRISFICRRNCIEIFDTVVKSVSEENRSRGLCIRGHSGVGKSYSIYYLASRLRINDKIRITYINSCEEWYNDHINNKYLFQLKELMCTFSNDVMSPLTLADWAIFVMKGLTRYLDEKLDELTGHSKWVEVFRLRNKDKNIDGRFKMFINELMIYIDESPYYWIWIFDQHNSLCKHKVLGNYPFNLATTLPSSLCSNGLIIVSTSTNNEEFPTEFESWNHFDFSGGYKDDEFREWCKLHNYNTDEDLLLKLHLDKVRFWTSSYPLELDLWYLTDGTNFEDKTSKYMKQRESEIALAHENYRKNLSKERRSNLNSCVVTMVLESTRLSNVDFGLDRQFMYKENILTYNSEGEKNDEISKQAIINSQKKHPLQEFSDPVSDIFLSVYTKGRLVELYIIELLGIKKMLKFKITRPDRQLSVAYNLMIKMHEIIKFVGNGTPIESFDANLNTLFIPLSPNYPGVHFLIWDTNYMELFAFQIAISSPTSHRKSKSKFIEGENSLKSKWATLCGIEKNKVKFIWLVPDSFIKSDRSKDSLYLSFSNIKELFPALNDL
ncbi:21430_t:CDS:2, partial [Gigaspora margarita]